MTKDEAIREANEFYEATNQHAFVVENDFDFDWYCKDYFQLGGEYGRIIYGTNW